MKGKKIELPKEERNEIIKDLKIYFLKEKDEEIGDLAADMLLDFLVDSIGPYFYNRGIKDAYSFMSEKIEDLYGLEKKPR